MLSIEFHMWGVFVLRNTTFEFAQIDRFQFVRESSIVTGIWSVPWVIQKIVILSDIKREILKNANNGFDYQASTYLLS